VHVVSAFGWKIFIYFWFVPVQMFVKCCSSFFSKGKLVFSYVLVLKRVSGRGLKESLRYIFSKILG